MKFQDLDSWFGWYLCCLSANMPACFSLKVLGSRFYSIAWAGLCVVLGYLDELWEEADKTVEKDSYTYGFSWWAGSL